MHSLSVVGLGKLGSPMLGVFASKGFRVVGVDINDAYVNKINEGLAPVEEPGLQDLLDKARGNYTASTSIQSAVLESDATFIIVPTPTDTNGIFTSKYVVDVAEKIGEALREKKAYHLVVITSTLMPESTEGEVQKILEEKSGKTCGEDFGLSYSPEFIALGNVVRNLLKPDFVLIGANDKKAIEKTEAIYRQTIETGTFKPQFRIMNCVSAEITKIALNSYVTMKMTFANMLARLCENVDGANADDVAHALGGDSRIGKKYLKGSVGYGGPCFPRDNVAFSKLFDRFKLPSALPKTIDDLNAFQNEYLAQLVLRLNRSGKPVGILGLSYKPDTDVTERSPSLSLVESLVRLGLEVQVYDARVTRGFIDGRCKAVATAQDLVDQSGTIVSMVPDPIYRDIHLSHLEADSVLIDCWGMFSNAQMDHSKRFVLGRSNRHFRNDLSEALNDIPVWKFKSESQGESKGLL